MAINKYLFQRVAKHTEFLITSQNAKESRKWYRAVAEETQRASPKAVINNADPSHAHDAFSPGSMYCFFYDPKYKDSPKILPYYDRFPLVFPISVQSDRILSLNMHYLPPYYRAKLMDALYTLSNSYKSKKKYDDSTVLNLSYQTLKSAAKFKAFEPCIKVHLLSHIRSSFTYIEPSQWDQILLLPLQRFERKNAAQVWSDSVSKIG